MSLLLADQHQILRDILVKTIPVENLPLLLQDARLPIGSYDDSGPIAVRWDRAIRLAERHGVDSLKRFLRACLSTAPVLLEEPSLRPLILRWGLLPSPAPSAPPSPALASPTPPSEPAPLPTLELGFTYVHLSDLHFGQDAAHASSRFEQAIVVERLLEDLEVMRNQLGAPDFLFFTGDLAFSGQQAQYDLAVEYLKRVCEIARLRPEQVFLVPGNHDVDRAFVASDFMARVVHRDLRAKPSRIDDLLADPSSMERAVFPKFRAFAQATAHYGRAKLTTELPFSLVDLPGPRGRPLRILGLNTCLLSHDSEDSPATLALGAGQLHQAFTRVPRDTLVVVLMHHPPAWLVDGAELERTLQLYPHLLFTGHLHRSSGRIVHSLDHDGLLHFTAGASCASSHETHSHAYAWGRLNQAGLDYFPRYYSELRGEFRANHDFNLLPGHEHVHIRAERLPERLEDYLR